MSSYNRNVTVEIGHGDDLNAKGKPSIWLPVVIGLANPPIGEGQYIRPVGQKDTTLSVRKVDDDGTVHAGNQTFKQGMNVERFSAGL